MNVRGTCMSTGYSLDFAKLRSLSLVTRVTSRPHTQNLIRNSCSPPYHNPFALLSGVASSSLAYDVRKSCFFSLGGSIAYAAINLASLLSQPPAKSNNTMSNDLEAKIVVLGSQGLP
jgi:hypothetical protein